MPLRNLLRMWDIYKWVKLHEVKKDNKDEKSFAWKISIILLKLDN